MPAPIIVVIPAHDEAHSLGGALSALRAAAPPPDSFIVIADHCSDSTAQIAREYGATVWERIEGSGGKGEALKWLFASDLVDLKDDPGLIIVIIDADTTVKSNFFAEVQSAFESGARAAQSFVQPIGLNSTAAMLAAYSEVLSQVADDSLRARLGWPAPLRGTGMALRANLLGELLPHVHTRTEDIELSLLLAERGVRTAFLPEAVVYDPKPPDSGRVSRQRARWLLGQAQVWRDYWPLIARLVMRGSAVWWLLSALLLKPKTAWVALKAAAATLGLIPGLPQWLRITLAVPLVFEVAYYVLGLGFVPRVDRARYARALLCAPLYLWVWTQSVLVAARTRSGWLSVRH